MIVRDSLTYEHEYEIKYYEMNALSALKESSFLLLLQDAATKSAESLGFGSSFIMQNNYAWFLLKYRIEFDSYPVDLNSLKIRTTPRGGVKLFAYREFEILTPNGERIGRANSIWSLIDLNAKKMLPIMNTAPNFPSYEKRDDDLVFEKIPPINSMSGKAIFDIYFDDIDINQHANNSNYIRWALEPLGFEFRFNNTVKTIDMSYKKEIASGKVLSVYEFNPILNTTNHIVKNAETNDELCQIFIKWEKVREPVRMRQRRGGDDA